MLLLVLLPQVLLPLMMNYLMNHYHLQEVEMNYYLQAEVLQQVEGLKPVVEEHLPVEVEEV